MTRKELQDIRYIKHMIRSLELQKIENYNYLSAVKADGMPHGSGGVGDPVASAYMRINELDRKLAFQIQRLAETEKRANEFIMSIEDEEMKVIIQKYFINCLSQEAIGYELYMSRSKVSKKLTKFFREQERGTK